LWEYGLFALGVKDSPNPFIKGELEQLCKQQNCLFVQVEILDYSNPPLSWEKIGWAWKRDYYKNFIVPYIAAIDLTKSEDEILAVMKPKGRYNIKLARKKWVEIIESKNNSPELKAFYSLIQETTSRDGFLGNTQKYYEQFLLENKTSQLLLAKIDGVVVAGGIFIFEKEVSIYYYGASTSDTQYRNSMAPYLLQWEAISRAKAYWSKLYDFLWVATPGDENSSLAGVTSFKKKLTPDIRQVSQATIYVNKKMKYGLIQILRKITK